MDFQKTSVPYYLFYTAQFEYTTGVIENVIGALIKRNENTYVGIQRPEAPDLPSRGSILIERISDSPGRWKYNLLSNFPEDNLVYSLEVIISKRN